MKRLATNRDFLVPSGQVECVSIDERGVFFWHGDDLVMVDQGLAEIGFSFPVTLEFVHEFFEGLGRTLDVTLLPSNYVSNPYGVNL